MEPRLQDRIDAAFPLWSSPTQTRLVVASACGGQLWSVDTEERITPSGMLPLHQPDVDNVRRDIAKQQAALLRAPEEGGLISAINRESFLAIISVLDAAGSRLVLVEAPTCLELARDPRYIARLDAVARELHRLAAGRAGFAILATGREGFPVEQMQNTDHLATVEARRSYSTGIVHRLLALGP